MTKIFRKKSMKFTPYFLLLLVTFQVQTAIASTQYIDSVIAIVEDDVITNYELSKEVERIRNDLIAQGRKVPPEVSLNRQVLELMVNKSILLQQANSRGVVITDTQLNSTLQNMAQHNKMSLTEFRDALVKSGIDYNKFRQDIRDELAINHIKNQYALQNVDVSEQEVDEFMARNKDSNSSEEYKLSHLLIAVPDGASSEQVALAREKIQGIKQNIEKGANFAQQASEFSDGGNALQGGDLGWRKLAEIPSLFSNIVPNMKPGEISQVLRSASGFHIIKLDEKRNGEQVLVKQTHARHILIKTDEITSSQQAKQKLEDIRQRILNGDDFAELAKQYSDDPGSGGLGGDLGWFGTGTMVKEFQQVVDNTPVNGISEVFRSPFGWHLVQVLGRRTVDETEESKRNSIRAQLEEQKKKEVLDLWQRRLRDQAFVKLINDK
jgi:peptidyl-prolyl cis-trans isomerase SurA